MSSACQANNHDDAFYDYTDTPGSWVNNQGIVDLYNLGVGIKRHAGDPCVAHCRDLSKGLNADVGDYCVDNHTNCTNSCSSVTTSADRWHRLFYMPTVGWRSCLAYKGNNTCVLNYSALPANGFTAADGTFQSGCVSGSWNNTYHRCSCTLGRSIFNNLMGSCEERVCFWFHNPDGSDAGLTFCFDCGENDLGKWNDKIKNDFVQILKKKYSSYGTLAGYDNNGRMVFDEFGNYVYTSVTMCSLPEDVYISQDNYVHVYPAPKSARGNDCPIGMTYYPNIGCCYFSQDGKTCNASTLDQWRKLLKENGCSPSAGYVNSNNQIICCPAGTTPDADSTMCLCASGYEFNRTTGQCEAKVAECLPGYYFDTTNQICTICPAGHYCPGGVLSNIDTGLKDCPTLTSGYQYTSDTGLIQPTQCREIKRPDHCDGGYITKTATNASTWGTGVSTLTAAAGYKLSGSGENQMCVECGDAYYSTGNNGTTSCTACPAARDNTWTVHTTSTTATSWNACYETHTPDNCASGTTRQDAISASAYSSTETVATALSANPNYYVDGTSCPACSGLGGGLYPNSPGGAIANTACYSNDLAGHYIANSTDSTLTECPDGRYKTSGTANYPNTTTCLACTALTGLHNHSSLPRNATTDCYVTTTPGYYVGSGNASLFTTCLANGYCPGGIDVHYGSSGGRIICAYAAGYYDKSAAGSTSVDDCYLNTTAGKYVQTAGSGIQVDCSGYNYCGLSNKIYYGGTDTSGHHTTGIITACPAVETGWTAGSGTGWALRDSCYETRDATVISQYCATGQLKRNQYNVPMQLGGGGGGYQWGAASEDTTFTPVSGAIVDRSSSDAADLTCLQCTCTPGAHVASCTAGAASGDGNNICNYTYTCATGYNNGGASSGSFSGNENVSANTSPDCATANVYTINYTLNGGTQASSGVPTSYTYGVGATVNGVPTRSHSSFDGWCTDSNLTSCSAAQTISTTDTGDKTFYAKWSCDTGYHASGNSCVANTCTVEFKTGTTSLGTQSFTYGTAQNLTTLANLSNVPTVLTNYWSFSGWGTGTNATVTYTNGQSLSTICTTDGATITLYGIWTRNIPFKYYNSATATSVTTSNKEQKYYNTNATTAAATSVTPDYTLYTSTQNGSSWAPAGGWVTSTTVTGSTTATLGTTATVTPAYNAAAPTYYALYSRTPQVAYNGNGNTGGSTSNSNCDMQKIAATGTASSSSCTLASNGFTRTGYTFSKWRTGASSGTQYDAGALYTFPNTSWATNKTYSSMYAQWTPNVSGAITLNSNRFASSSATTAAQNATTAASPTPVYTRYATGVYTTSANATNNTNAITALTTLPVMTGYTFQGFYTGKAGSGTQVVNSSGTFLDAAKTAVSATGGTATWYAHWTATPYTLTIMSGNGIKGIEPPSVSSGFEYPQNSDATWVYRTVNYNGQYDISAIVPAFKRGYSGYTYTITSGPGSLNGTTFTAGAGDTTITINATTLAAPTAVTISGGATKVYNYQTTGLTTSVTLPAEYENDITVYYQFKAANYANSTCGSYSNVGTASTTSTYTVAKAEFRGYKCYSVNAYAVGDGGLTSSSVSPSSATTVGLINRTITFNAGSGTISGTSPLYVSYNNAALYTTATGTTTGTAPTASISGYSYNRFKGWYTAATNGYAIYVSNAAGTSVSLSSATVSNYISSSKWQTTTDQALYAQYCAVGYNWNGSSCVANSYTVTVSAGNGISTVAASGWTANANNTQITKDYNYGSTINLPNIVTPTHKNGYTGTAYSVSGNCTINASNVVTVGDGACTVTVTATGITAPTASNISLGSNVTKTHNKGTTTLTASLANASTTYDSAISLRYSFAENTTASDTATCGSTYGSYSTASTTATKTIAKDAYLGYKCYKVKIYATDGTLSSTATEITTPVRVGLIRRAITFNATQNSGTLSGTSPLYVSYDSATLYTTATGNTTANVPSASRTGYAYNGWYDATSSGNQIYNNSGTITSSAVTGYVGNSKWKTDQDRTLYAQYTISSYRVTVNAGNGISTVAATDWINSGTASMYKDHNYNSSIDLSSVVTPTHKNGYTGVSYSVSGSCTLSGSTVTLGAGACTVTVNATGLADPTIVIPANSVRVYNNADTLFNINQTTAYANGVTLYYQVGETPVSTSQTCGTSYTYGAIGNTNTTSGTITVKTIAKDAYLGYVCYKVRLYVVGEGGLQSNTVEPTEARWVAITHRTLWLNGNGGTLSDSSARYMGYGTADIYAGAFNNNIASLPTATKAGYTFSGWYTAATGGSQVYNSSLELQPSVSNYTNASSQWIATGNETLYAHWTANTNTLTLNKNGGSGTIKNNAGTTYTGNTAGSMTCTTDSSVNLPTWASAASSNNTTNIANGSKVFLGWSTSSTCNPATDPTCLVTSITCPTGNATYYAVWQTPSCTATHGTATATTTVDNKPTCSVTCDCGYQTSGTYSGTAGATSYSYTCTARTVTFTWANGGHGTAPTTPASCTYDGTFTMPAAMTATGYTFNKWNTSGTTTTQFNAGQTNVACTSANLGNNACTGTATITGSWTTNTNTAYVVNHYIKDLGATTYTLHSSSNLTGTTDDTVTLANEAISITGFTYDQGFAGTSTNGTNRPNSGAVTTTTILPSGNLVIDLYYTRNTYEITVIAGAGFSRTTTTGWTQTGDAGMKKSFEYQATLDLPNAAPVSRKNGYTGASYTLTSGAGSINGSNVFTVGDGVATITVAATGITAPTAVTISGGTTQIYNYAAVPLTTSVTTPTYDSGISLIYQFEYTSYSNSACGTSYTNVGTASTTSTYSVPKDAYRNRRCYNVKVYASGDGGLTSSTIEADTATIVRFIRKGITFNANGGTLSPETPTILYPTYDTATMYTSATGNTTGTIPTAYKAGCAFNGWWDAASGGHQILTASNQLSDVTVSGYIANSKWMNTGAKNVYAQFNCITVTEPTNTALTYNGTSTTNGTAQNCAGVTLTDAPSGATVTYSTSASGTYTSATPTLTTVAQSPITVYYKVSASGYTDATGSYTCTMNSKAMTVTATDKALTYNGSAQSCANVSVSDPSDTANATITYSTTEGGSYSATAPTLTNAGTNTAVWYKVTANNYTMATGHYTCTMNQATGSTTIMDNTTNVTNSGSSTTYGTNKTLNVTCAGGATPTISNNGTTSVATASISNGVITMVPVTAGATTTTITVSCPATTNYAASSATYTLTVNKANCTVTLGTNSGTTAYPDVLTTSASTTSGATMTAASSATGVATASVSGGTLTMTPAAQGSATITVTSPATTNYNACSATYDLTVNRGTCNITLDPTSGTITYPTTTTSTFNINWGSCNGNKSIWASDITKATAAFNSGNGSATVTFVNNGTATITVKSEQTDQYNQATANYTVTLNRETITLDWDENGGGALTNGSCSYGGDLTLPAAPTRTGYTFLGWKTAANETAGNYRAAGATITGGCTSTYTGVTSGTSTAIQAQWQANTDTQYKVYHYTKNVTGSAYTQNGSVDNLTGTSDASVTLSTLVRPSLINGGFTYDKGFAGTAAAGPTMPAANTAVTTTTILPDGTRVISLYYNRNTYPITIVAGSGILQIDKYDWTPNADNTRLTKDCVYGENIILPNNMSIYWKNGYEGLAYSIANDDNGTLNTTTNVYTVGLGSGTITVSATGIIAPESVSISGGTTKTYNESATTLVVTPTVSAQDVGTYDSSISYRYAFANTTPGASTTCGSYGSYGSFDSSVLTVAKNAFRGYSCYKVQVKAVGEGGLESSAVESTGSTTMGLINRGVTFDATTNGGTLSGTSPVYVSYDNAATYTTETGTTSATVPTATKSGHTFNGWYTAATGGTMVYNASNVLQSGVAGYTSTGTPAKWIATGDQTLYAQFTVNTYTITLNKNGGSGKIGSDTTVNTNNATITCTYGETVTLPAYSSTTQLTKGTGATSAVFRGWANSNDCTATTCAYTSLECTGDKTVYAVWIIPTCVAGTGVGATSLNSVSGNAPVCNKTASNGNYCTSGTQTGTAGATSLTVTCTACPALDTGYSYVSGTGWTSYSQCQETKGGTNCSGALTKTASSASAWGNVVSTLTAPAGSYVNGESCDLCATGSYTASANSLTSCTMCTNGTTTNGTGQTSCNATCVNNNNYDYSWATPVWNNNNPTHVCEVANCAQGSHYATTLEALTDGYTELQYIESTGTQYINAMYTPSASGYEYEIEVATLNGNSAIIGCQSNDALLYSSHSGNKVIVLIQGTSASFTVDTVQGRFYKHNLSYDGTTYTYKVDGAVIGQETKTINPLPYFLFGNTRSSGTEVYDLGSVRIGKAKLYNNGSLVRNFIPAKRNSDNAIGMYDTVSGQFFENAGSGVFTAGPDAANNACEECVGATYQDVNGTTATACTACPTGYDYNTDNGKTAASMCQTNCAGGSTVITANQACSGVGTGYWSAGGVVNYGSTGTRTACPTGLTTTGSGAGADEAGDCGRILHIGNYTMRLRSVQKTTPSLKFDTDNNGVADLYGNMETIQRNMSSTSNKKFKVNRGGTTYYIYDDTAVTP